MGRGKPRTDGCFSSLHRRHQRGHAGVLTERPEGSSHWAAVGKVCRRLSLLAW